MSMFDPQSRNALAAFLAGEKDTRPYSETYQRGLFAPLGVNGYTGQAEAAIPSMLGGGGWGTLHDIMQGRSVTKDEIDSAAMELGGAAQTGGIAAAKPRGAIGSGAMRETPNLPMDQASRMARAKEMGFDTDTTWYHGTNQPLTEITPGMRDPGAWFTTDMMNASNYARGADAQLYSTRLKTENPFVVDFDYVDGKIAPMHGGKPLDFDNNVDIVKSAFRNGYDSVHFPAGNFSESGNTMVVKNGNQVRDVTAAFDPARSDSANLLYSNPKEGMAANSLMQGAKNESQAPLIKQVQPGLYDVQVGDKFAGTASVASGKPFISAVSLQPEFQRQGIGEALYSTIEKDMGRTLVPSPLGLSPQATAFWKKRLAGLTPEERAAVVNEAKAIGGGYGIKDEHLRARLDALYSNPKEGMAASGLFADQQQEIQPWYAALLGR